MEASKEGPDHIGLDLERPELLQPRSHFSHLWPECGSGSNILQVGDTHGHRPGQHDIRTDRPIQHLPTRISRISHNTMRCSGGHFKHLDLQVAESCDQLGIHLEELLEPRKPFHHFLMAEEGQSSSCSRRSTSPSTTSFAAINNSTCRH